MGGERFAADSIHRQRVFLSPILELFSREIPHLAVKSRILLKSENVGQVEVRFFVRSFSEVRDLAILPFSPLRTNEQRSYLGSNDSPPPASLLRVLQVNDEYSAYQERDADSDSKAAVDESPMHDLRRIRSRKRALAWRQQLKTQLFHSQTSGQLWGSIGIPRGQVCDPEAHT